MAKVKRVTIFTGYVDETPLERDVRALKQSLGDLRGIFAGRSIILRTEQYDDTDLEGLQQVMDESDVCVFLFCTDFPELASAQFARACDALDASGDDARPAIMVWFKDPVDEDLSAELVEFQRMLDQDMGHFFSRYAQIDTVQFRLLLHLEREGAGLPFSCDGTALMDHGRIVMDFRNTAAYSGNEALRSARELRESLEERLQSLLDKADEGELDDDLYDEIPQLSEHIDAAAQEERRLQEEFVSDMRRYVRELAEDRQMSPRRRKAISLFTEGRYREANALLDSSEIERDMRSGEERAEVAAAEALSERGKVLDGIKSLLMKVQTLRTLVEEEGKTRDAEIRQVYALAIDYEERNGFEPLAAVGYGTYLISVGVVDKAIDYLDAACEWYHREVARAVEAERRHVEQPADPYAPSLQALRQGLADALGALVDAYAQGSKADAAYAASERIDVLQELFPAEPTDEQVCAMGRDLIAVAQVMRSARRVDDAEEYLEQACELLDGALDAKAAADTAETLVEALEEWLDLARQLDSPVADALEDRLLASLRLLERISDEDAYDERLVRTLRSCAYRALDRNQTDEARELVAEALALERDRYERAPSAESALALGYGYRASTILAARMRASEDYLSFCEGRMHTLVREYLRAPRVELQKALRECMDDLCGRWRQRPTQAMAELLRGQLLDVVRAVEGREAPGENSLEAGHLVGEALCWAHTMASHLQADTSSPVRLLADGMETLRAKAGAAGPADATPTARDLALYSGAFEHIGRYWADEGRRAQGYAAIQERLCALRLAQARESEAEVRPEGTDVESNAVANTAVSEVTSYLAQALAFAYQQARDEGRDAESQALFLERLDLLRAVFAAQGGLPQAYRLNLALFEGSQMALARGDVAEMGALLDEVWHMACGLYEREGSHETMANLVYVGKRVTRRYREAQLHEQADQTTRTCAQTLWAYRAAHPTPEENAWVTTVLWMYVFDLRRNGRTERVDEVFGLYGAACRELAASDLDTYLSYLHRSLNRMITFEADEAFARQVIALIVDAAEEAWTALEASGAAHTDATRTFSSVLELAVLVTLEKGHFDMADRYVETCIGLYERRYVAARAAEGDTGMSVALDECALQLSKELSRLSDSMRRFGRPERADEMMARAHEILGARHEQSPQSRLSYNYASQLYNEAVRLRKEGRASDALELQAESVHVLDRYRLADATERNFLWYTRALSDLARAYRRQGQADKADEAQGRMLDEFRARYREDHSRSLLTRYLAVLMGEAKRRADAGTPDGARELYEEAARLAEDAFRDYGDVESARQASTCLGRLYQHLRAAQLKDEASDVNSRQVEVHRFLFARCPTQRGARVFANSLYGEAGRLRFLAKRLDRKDWLKRSYELFAERIEVMRWLAQRDTTAARELADQLKDEVSIVDPREPWVLKSMREIGEDLGRAYPYHLGVSRSRICLEALWYLFRQEPSQELADELCDVKGVLVQFLTPWRQLADGSREPRARWLERQHEAAAELYELVPMLEERYAQMPDEAHAYRLSYYLKVASFVHANVGSLDESLAVLARRAELLRAQHGHTQDATSAIKYAHALADQAKCCKDLGRLDDAAALEERRLAFCLESLASEDTDERGRTRLTSELVRSRAAREELYELQGADATQERVANLQELCALYDARRSAGGQAAMDATRKEAPYQVCLAACLRSLGQDGPADRAYLTAAELFRAARDEGGHPVAHELRECLVSRADLLYEHLLSARERGQDKLAQQIAGATMDTIGEALDLPADEGADDAPLTRAHLHALRYELTHDEDPESALDDALSVVASLKAAPEDAVDAREMAQALTRLGQAYDACGQPDEARRARMSKTEELRRAYLRKPSCDLGLYLAGDLQTRIREAQEAGEDASALELCLERLELLYELKPEDPEGTKRRKGQLRQAVRTLIALTQGDGEGTVDAGVLERAEAMLTQQAQEGDASAAAAHLDILRNAYKSSGEEPSQLDALAHLARQTEAYGRRGLLGAGAARQRLAEAAEAFSALGDEEQVAACRRKAVELLVRIWRRSGAEADGQVLYQELASQLAGCEDAEGTEEQLELLLRYREVILWLGRHGKLAQADDRAEELTRRIMACADQVGDDARSVAARLTLAEGAYARAEQPDVALVPLAEEIAGLLDEAADQLKGMRAGREAGWLRSEAHACQRNLGKAGFSWWRMGLLSLPRPWEHTSELGETERRMQRASHFVRLSLDFGDWDKRDPHQRTFRNLPLLRLNAYAKGLDPAERCKRLERLGRCLLSASTALWRRHEDDSSLIAESVVLRCEMFEALFDVAVLQDGTSQAKQALATYRQALNDFVMQLRAPEYGTLAYQDVKTWATGLRKNAQADVEGRHGRI